MDEAHIADSRMPGLPQGSDRQAPKLFINEEMILILFRNIYLTF
jgi:hypothetical protein